MLTLGTGVGGGFVENGKLAAGSLYADAAEIFGHITVEYGGRQCTCGRRGCLEAYCSATALMRRGREVFGREVSAKEIFALAGSGNAAAAELTEEFAEYLAAGAVSLANALRPQAIVFGGGVSGSAGDFLPIIDRAFERGSLRVCVCARESRCGAARERCGHDRRGFAAMNGGEHERIRQLR